MNKKPSKLIGFIGLGIMGKPMVKNLLKHNYSINFFARKKTVIKEIKKLGGTYCSSIEEVADTAKIIITNLPNSNDVKNIILGRDGLIKKLNQGTIIIDMSTISPKITKSIHDKLKRKKIYLIDAPVSGGEIGAINGSLSIMVGGEKHIFNKIKSILQILGNKITYIGKSGSGQITKICNQILVAQTMIGVSEILLIAKKNGCNQKLVQKALLGGFAYSKILEIHGERMIINNYKPGFKASLHFKDLDIAKKLVSMNKLSLSGTKLAYTLMDKVIKNKLNNKDSSIINKIIKDMNK
tara:strand:- start:328 stop:1215 length:888 start_codon:yes stop_codon:yes gene_type:complete